MSEERPPTGNPEQEPEPQPTPEPGQQEPVQEPEAQPPEPQPERTDWRDRRIGEQQQRLRDRNARIAELEQQLAQFQQSQQQNPGQQQQYPPPPQQLPQGQSDLQRQIQEAAAQMAQQQEFNRRCNEVAESGRKAYNGFDQRVQRLTGLVDSNDPQQVQAYNNFLNAVMETGQAPRLIWELGGDLNEASHIMAMNPVKMAVELTRMAAKPGTEASSAPRPLNPAATAGQNNRLPIAPDDPDRSDTLDIREWMARRNEQISSRRTRSG